MERIVCPKCGEQIASTARVRGMIVYCPEKEICGQCSCGEKYNIRLSFFNSLILSVPRTQNVLAC